MMGKEEFDFDGLKANLLAQAGTILMSWLPGVRKQGNEYVCSNLQGGSGKSFSVNLTTGVWKDFADGAGGGDLISLYAAIHGLKQGEAYTQLNDQYGNPSEAAIPTRPHPGKNNHKIAKPPVDTPTPLAKHPALKIPPSKLWCYVDSESHPIFYQARYETKSGKTFLPWSWCTEKKQWISKGFPSPRPLYGLDRLAAEPGKRVLIVEGEKAADAATKIAGHVYTVVTWPNGGNAYNLARWEPVFGREVLIWPDSDSAGIKSAEGLASLLAPHCEQMKVIDVESNGGWDAADALEDGWSWEDVRDWAKSRVRKFTASVSTEVSRETKPVRETKPMETPTIRIESDLPDLGGNVYEAYEQMGLIMNSEGKYALNNAANVARVCNFLFGDQVWFDEFRCRFYSYFNFTTMKRGSQPREIDLTHDISDLMIFMQEKLQLYKISSQNTLSGLVHLCRLNRRNEAKEYIKSLEWDEDSRLRSFFETYCGAENNEYSQAVSLNFWISMVARIMQPGCKVDNMIILEGAQGVMKGEILKAIAGERWYGVVNSNLKSKDLAETLQGKLLMEFAEMASFNKHTANEIKSIMTTATDRYRPAYGKNAEDFPRQCVFAGSTNDQGYLRDTTGNRRFWPISTSGRMQVNKVRAQRDQLFAEAVHLYQQGKTWWEMPDRLTRIEQEKRREADPWEEIIASWLGDKDEAFPRQVAMECLNLHESKVSRQESNRIIQCLEALGFKNTGETGNFKLLGSVDWVRKQRKMVRQDN